MVFQRTTLGEVNYSYPISGPAETAFWSEQHLSLIRAARLKTLDRWWGILFRLSFDPHFCCSVQVVVGTSGKMTQEAQHNRE